MFGIFIAPGLLQIRPFARAQVQCCFFIRLHGCPIFFPIALAYNFAG
jgi:hypothetical protein